MSSEIISIPVQTLPAEEIKKITEILHVKAGKCLSKKLSKTEHFMRICQYGQPGRETSSYETVTIKFNAQKFGFGLNDLVVLPNETFGLCVGVSNHASQPKVWFVSKEAPGIFYWPEANSKKSFISQGFSKVSPAG